MNVDLTIPQKEFFQSTAKATCAVAGFGSGKTQATMYRLITTMMQYPKADMLYSAPTIPLIRDILWAKLDEFLPQIGLKHTVNKSESIVYIHGLGKIFCRSMDNPGRLVGFEVLDAFLDELDILTTEKALEVFRKIKARCRLKVYAKGKEGKKEFMKKSQQYVSTTPEGFKATYELFKKNPIPNSHLVQMSTYSNPYLPDDYIDDLRSTYPPQLIEAYLNGEFVNLVAMPVWGGFDALSSSIAHNQGDDTIIKPGETLHIGQDFNVGRGCAVVYVERFLPKDHPANPTSSANPNYVHDPMKPPEPWRVLIAADEVFNSFDTPDTIRVLNERYPADMFKERIVYPDSTGTNRKSVNATISDIWLMRNAGFQILKKNKNPSIKDRVTAGNAALLNSKGERRAYVDTVACPNLTDSFIQQVYDKNGLPAKGEGEFDDMADAATYPLCYHWPIKRSRMIVDELRGT